MLGRNALGMTGPRRMPEMSGAFDGGLATVMTGLMHGTRVASTAGWRPVEAVAVGDKVLTFDEGMQTVVRVTRTPIWHDDVACPRHIWPLEVPVGALGNRELILLMPSQSILIESDMAETMFGDPFALIPALALDGVRGICRVPPPSGAEAITLHFEEEQVVFANSGAMFFCPPSCDILDSALEGSSDPMYSVVPLDEARQITNCLNETAPKTGRSFWPNQFLGVFTAT